MALNCLCGGIQPSPQNSWYPGCKHHKTDQQSQQSERPALGGLIRRVLTTGVYRVGSTPVCKSHQDRKNSCEYLVVYFPHTVNKPLQEQDKDPRQDRNHFGSVSNCKQYQRDNKKSEKSLKKQKWREPLKQCHRTGWRHKKLIWSFRQVFIVIKSVTWYQKKQIIEGIDNSEQTGSAGRDYPGIVNPICELLLHSPSSR